MLGIMLMLGGTFRTLSHTLEGSVRWQDDERAFRLRARSHQAMTSIYLLLSDNGSFERQTPSYNGIMELDSSWTEIGPDHVLNAMHGF